MCFLIFRFSLSINLCGSQCKIVNLIRWYLVGADPIERFLVQPTRKDSLLACVLLRSLGKTGRPQLPGYHGPLQFRLGFLQEMVDGYVSAGIRAFEVCSDIINSARGVAGVVGDPLEVEHLLLLVGPRLRFHLDWTLGADDVQVRGFSSHQLWVSSTIGAGLVLRVWFWSNKK